MKLDILKRTEAVDQLAARTTDRRHRTILQNFRRHATLEVCGLWEDILVPEMTVEEPVYFFHTESGLQVYRGMREVRALYKSFVDEGSTVMYHTDCNVAVTDHGLHFEYVNNRFYTGDALAATGVAVDDLDGHYIQSTTTAMYWPYDERCRMIGEHVYRGADRSVRKIDASEVITQEDCRKYLLPLIPPVQECFLPA